MNHSELRITNGNKSFLFILVNHLFYFDPANDFIRNSSIVIRNCFLLFADNSPRPFACPGVGVRPLSADREPAPMAHSAIRADLHESLDVHGNCLAQISFHHPVSLDDVSNAHRLVLGQVFHLGIEINPCLCANLGGAAFADPVNIGQTYLNPFSQWQIHSRDSSQFYSP
jgi:hypothetical protein